MLSDHPSLAPQTAAILFTIPPAAVAAYRAWRAEADLAYMRAQIERQGFATALRLGGQEGWLRLTALPARGEAEPRYGTFGGGFAFVFRPGRGSCALTVEPPTDLFLIGAPEHLRTLARIADPLELAAEPAALLAATVATLDPQGILDERPDDPARPWRFALSGPALADLRAWGWDAAVPAAYAYTFMPTNIGCIARVADSYGGEVDLTGELD